MASRYRRFITGPLEYAQLFEIAMELNQRGVKCDLTWDIFTAQDGTQETVHFLDIRDCYTQVSTRGETHFIQTGQVQPLDRIVDEVLVKLLSRHLNLTCTCSHCYSHTYDNSDLEGAWAPNPSESCILSQKGTTSNTSQEAA